MPLTWMNASLVPRVHLLLIDGLQKQDHFSGKVILANDYWTTGFPFITIRTQDRQHLCVIECFLYQHSKEISQIFIWKDLAPFLLVVGGKPEKKEKSE